MSHFTDYLASVNGKAIDVDGHYGAQCWDSWSHYATNLIGVTPWQRTGTNWGGGCPSHPGYTCGLWYGFDRSGLGQWFDKIQGPPQRGDVAVWDWGSPAGPNSHVAIVVEDRGSNVYCMTQNPGPNHYGLLNKKGILGYFRPKNQSFFDGGGAAPTPQPGYTDGYTVVSGDSLSGIAAKYGIAWQDLYAANVDVIGPDPNLIYPGQVLRVPAAGGGGSAPAPSGGGKQRVIVAGDTLWDIAVQEYGHGAKYIDIFNASNFRSGDPSLIYPGEIAIIP